MAEFISNSVIMPVISLGFVLSLALNSVPRRDIWQTLGQTLPNHFYRSCRFLTNPAKTAAQPGAGKVHWRRPWYLLGNCYRSNRFTWRVHQNSSPSNCSTSSSLRGPQSDIFP